MHLRYLIKSGDKRTNLKGKEHREAVHFLPFAAAGLFGRSGAGGQHQRLLTWVLCELAAISKSAPDVRPKTWAEAKSVCRRSSRWNENDFQALFGPSHTTKLHRAESHLLDQFFLRGNFQDVSTGVNEALHKFVKLAYTLTTKNCDNAALQMVLTEQIEIVVRLSRQRQASKTTSKKASRIHRMRAREAVSSVSDFAAPSGLVTLDEALQCASSGCIRTQSGTLLPDAYIRRARGDRTMVWATPHMKRRPWYDWVRYPAEDGTVGVREARAIIAARNGTLSRTVVVQCAETASSVPECPFTSYGCERLRWCHQVWQGKIRPILAAVSFNKIIDVLCVDHDWEVWVDRVGVCRFPKSFASGAGD